MKKTQEVYKVYLSPEERQELLKKTKTGKGPVREIKRALILLKSDRSEGYRQKDAEIAKAVNVTLGTVHNVRKRFCKNGLKSVKDNTEAMGRHKTIDGEVEAHIIAMALSAPPKGQARWTLRMIANKMVELHLINTISHESVFRTLKKKRLNLG